jgi:hypothetical protein
MVDFWFNHFNVNAYDGYDQLWIGNYEEAAIRPHALGHFRDLLLATAHHPAMLYYLDNESNTAPGSPNARGLFAGLNENYARELMELHTLGVDGGYTQDDVATLARILTGWGFDYHNLSVGSGSAFSFDASRHDAGDKIFLGQRIPAGGEEQGVAAIDILARSPATAHHLAFELAQYFVADNPPPALVDRLAQRFLDSDGDIKAVMADLLSSREFRDSAGQKYKTPYQYVLSAARAAGVEVNNPRRSLANDGAPRHAALPLPDTRTATRTPRRPGSAPTRPTCGPISPSLSAAARFSLCPRRHRADGAAARRRASAETGAAQTAPVDAAALEALLAPDPQRQYPRDGGRGAGGVEGGAHPRQSRFHAQVGATCVGAISSDWPAARRWLRCWVRYGRRAPTGQPQRLIVVMLRGAVDGLNVVVPYGDAAYYDARPTIAIQKPGADNGALRLTAFRAASGAWPR